MRLEIRGVLRNDLAQIHIENLRQSKKDAQRRVRTGPRPRLPFFVFLIRVSAEPGRVSDMLLTHVSCQTKPLQVVTQRLSKDTPTTVVCSW